MVSPQGNAPARNGAFQSVPGPRITRAQFDLSHEKKLTFDMGQLIPTCCLEMVPGDKFEISNDLVVRFQALLSPVLHQVDVSIHYFFVPNRLVWPKVDTSGDDWESFITGGTDGLNSAVLPRWDVDEFASCHNIGSLWDYFGLPTWEDTVKFSTKFPGAIAPLALPARAYYLIWNEYYRDETLQDVKIFESTQTLLTRSWAKDYFTSALPWQQRGQTPALPISGFSSAQWPDSYDASYLNSNVTVANNAAYARVGLSNSQAEENFAGFMDNNTVDLGEAITFDIADIRMASVVQRLLERNARSGVRYTEFLQSNFGVYPRDERLQRPEYIGGMKQPVIFSEVLQQSATASQPTPQGNQAGHALSVGRNYIGRYSCKEHGYIIGIMSAMPVPAYQQGIPKEWARVSKYDYYFPEFANLSEQAVLNQELYVAADGLNDDIFGYQSRYNEYRYVKNSVCGLFRTTLNYWHLGRIFDSRPALNSDFISLDSTEVTALKRVAAVTSQPLMLASVGNNIRAWRPMPEFSDPGIYRV